MRCVYCNEELQELPYTCKFCNENFCSEHRMPEKHSCQGLKKYNNEKSKTFYKDKLSKKSKKKLPDYIKKAPKRSFWGNIKDRFR